MSTFTEFSAGLQKHPAPEASKILGKSYWRIDPGFEFYLTDAKDEVVVIERGYLSDGATVPKFLQWLIPVWGKYGQCAVVHDKLCETWETSKRKLNRKQVDGIFFEAMRVAKVNIVRRKAIEIGVTGYRWFKRPTQPSYDAMKQSLIVAYT